MISVVATGLFRGFRMLWGVRRLAVLDVEVAFCADGASPEACLFSEGLLFVSFSSTLFFEAYRWAGGEFLLLALFLQTLLSLGAADIREDSIRIDGHRADGVCEGVREVCVW